MSSQSPQQKSEISSPSIGFVERYALQYYTATLLYGVYALLHFYLQKPVYFFVFLLLFPFLGKLFPKDDLEVNNSKYHNRNVYHALPLASCVIANMLTITFLCLNFPYLNQTGLDRCMTVLSLAFLITPSIDASHELIHRPQKFFNVLGFLNMTIFLFNVYPTEHVYLHHKYVGTSKDPITCRKNLNLYYYTLRAYFSGHKFVYSYNKAIFLGCISLNAAYLAAIYYTGLISYGDSSLALQKLFFFIQIGLGGFIFLEIIEYIEHYGLIVREDVDKKSINELSSWNADGNMIHNWMIFRFQRHSDHHMNAYKYFTTLELTEKMPKFPITFYEGTFLALIPPLWYYLMDPYVDEQLLNKNVEKSHIKFTNFVRHSVFVVLSCASAYLYYVSVLQPVQAQ